MNAQPLPADDRDDEPLAEVVPLAPAREVSQKKKNGPSSSTRLLPRRTREFDALVLRLEVTFGRLNGKGLGHCLAHFTENREAFASCVTKAETLYQQGVAYAPLSLLCGMSERREDYRPPKVPRTSSRSRGA